MVVVSKPLIEQFLVKTSKPNTNQLIIPDIPLTDLSKPESKHHLVKACQDFGFFKVVNHGIPSKFINKLEPEAVKFFSPRVSIKEKFGPPDPFGYGNKSVGRNDAVGWVECLLLNAKPESNYPENFQGIVNDYVTYVETIVCES